MFRSSSSTRFFITTLLIHFSFIFRHLFRFRAFFLFAFLLFGSRFHLSYLTITNFIFMFFFLCAFFRVFHICFYRLCCYFILLLHGSLVASSSKSVAWKHQSKALSLYRCVRGKGFVRYVFAACRSEEILIWRRRNGSEMHVGSRNKNKCK